MEQSWVNTSLSFIHILLGPLHQCYWWWPDALVVVVWKREEQRDFASTKWTVCPIVNVSPKKNTSQKKNFEKKNNPWAVSAESRCGPYPVGIWVGGLDKRRQERKEKLNCSRFSIGFLCSFFPISSHYSFDAGRKGLVSLDVSDSHYYQCIVIIRSNDYVCIGGMCFHISGCIHL